jgi:hypothetical protein
VITPPHSGEALMTQALQEISDVFIVGLRWAARALGVMVIGTAALFLLGEGGVSLMRLTPREGILMVLFLTALAGMVVGWRHEALGGALTVGSLALFYVLEWSFRGRVPTGGALALVALPGLLFLCCAAWTQTAPPAHVRRPTR